jgi:N-acetylneuraminate synthase
VAEVAQTHDGSLGAAHAFVDAAAAAGADAIKFQTHLAAAESTPREPWRVPFSRQDASRYDYWRRMEFTPEQWRGLAEHAREQGLLFLSSPFSLEAVALLDELGMRAWKFASGEITNIPLIDAVVATGRPVILSSGMSTWTELDRAVGLVQGAGCDLTVLQCTTAYPCPPEQTGLNVLGELRERYGCRVGLSDHSATIYPGLAAVTLGAQMLEVHLTLSRHMFGPDVPASLTVEQLTDLVDGVRFIETALANPVDKEAVAAASGDLRAMFGRSIVATRPLAARTVLAAGDLAPKKPAGGIPAERLVELVGRRLRRDLRADEPLCDDDLEPVP